MKLFFSYSEFSPQSFAQQNGQMEIVRCFYCFFFLLSLEGEQEEEGHHETEQTHGLGKGESQDGVGEELLFERWVPGISDDERTEDGANTGTRSSYAHRRRTSADVLGGGIDVHRTRRCLEASDGAATEGRRQSRISAEQSGSGHRRRTQSCFRTNRCGASSRRRSSVTGQR